MSTVSVSSFFAEVVVVTETTTTTTTATTTEAAAASAARAAAAVATTRLTLFGNVHADGSTIEALTIHLLHRGLGRIPFRKRHEAKASRTPRFSVGDHLGFHDFSEGREGIA
jgi:hypothetical protein